MIANYGYEDGSGVYYISIDTDKCEQCSNRACLSACPEKILAVEENDWGDEVVIVVSEASKQLKYLCAPCKDKAGANNIRACKQACPSDAIKYTW